MPDGVPTSAQSCDREELRVLVLQGGGALGSYQAGVYEALCDADFRPGWIAGTSIGAINAALIAGNPLERRVERLRAFWEQASSTVQWRPFMAEGRDRSLFTEMAAMMVATFGVPGFFRPRGVPPLFFPPGSPEALSFYDTTPLRETLERLVDFEFLNSDQGPRLSVGAVNVRTGNLSYFDNREQRLGPEHIMASGALPPGFPPVLIDGDYYWDGGIVSNSPLQYVLDAGQDRDLVVFQVDLFAARGEMPKTLLEAAEREKDIRYSSRTRMNTDMGLEIHDVKAAVRDLLEDLPAELRDDPKCRRLEAFAKENAVTVVHLINRRRKYDSSSKDYEFSRVTMLEHWADGRADVELTVNDSDWVERKRPGRGVAVFDLGRDGLELEAAPAHSDRDPALPA